MNIEYFVTVDLKSSGQGIFVASATLSQQQVVATTFMAGPTGKAATIEIASTTTVAPDQPATVTNTGDEHHTILEFEIPKGEKGDKGDDATNPVESVNGKTGVVTLNHSDVGADESGSAATAEANANVYTDAQTAAAILESKGYTDDELQALAAAIGAQLAAKADLVGGLVPSSQLPAYVDDVLSYPNLAAFPVTGESGKIYVTEDTNLTYRWSGSAYVEISASLALGETASTAFAGNRGKAVEDALPGKADILAISQNTVPTRNAAGTGPADGAIGRASGAATANTLAQRNGAGQIFTATGTDGNHATNKTQMDAADAAKVSKAGDTMTGSLVFAGSGLGVRGDTTSSDTRISGGTINDGATVVLGGSTHSAIANRGDLRVGFSTIAQWSNSGFYVGGVGAPLTGTGMPNGVVTAPVGSTYIDKNATNGAIEWKKATGTGNTGWVVSVGDTGWIRISSWGTDGVVSGYALPSNMNPATGVAGSIWLQRTVSSVNWRITGATFTGNVGIDAPIGFRVGTMYIRVPVVTNSGQSITMANIGTDKVFVGSNGASTDTTYGAFKTYPTNSAWPTTLPAAA